MRSREELLAAACSLQEEGEYKRSIRVCNRLVKQHPTFAQGYFERGLCYYHLHEPEKALADFQQVLKLEPTYFHLRHWLARAYDAVGESLQAADLKLAELRENPEHFVGMGVLPSDWEECAQFFLKAGERGKAIATLKEYFREHAANVTTAYADSSTDPLRLYGKLMLDQGNLKEAEKAVKLALDNPYCNPVDQLLWVQILAARGDIDGALAAFDQFFPDGGWWDEAVQLKVDLLGRKNSGE